LTALVIVIGAMLAASVLASVLLVPMVLPWRCRLRWMTAVHASSLALTSGDLDAVMLYEVVLLGADVRDERIVACLATEPPTELIGLDVPYSASNLDVLQGWAQRSEPLLLTTTRDGTAALTRQSESVVTLPPRERVATDDQPSREPDRTDP
jgi:hypothetical protein